jgi:hypothetical protein
VTAGCCSLFVQFQGRCSGGDGGAKIFTQECGDGRGNLGLRGADRLADTEWFGVGAEYCHPDEFRCGDILAVIGPVVALCSAAVVRGDDECRLIAIKLMGLQPAPELSDKPIGSARGLQIKVVAAAMGPFVGLTQADVEQSRLMTFQVMASKPLLGQ